MGRQLKAIGVCEWLSALDQHHAHLSARLQEALSVPMPDAERVAWLKTEKLRVQDEITTLARYLREGPYEDEAANATQASSGQPGAPSTHTP
jgi:hypothetical protein